MESNIILLIILAASILGKANSVAIATCILLLAKLLHIENYLFPIIDKHGVLWGITLISATVLIPIANESITSSNIKIVFTSWIGITTLLISLFTTYLSGLGIRYITLEGHGDIMPAIVLGGVVGAAFLGGIPVGPLITSGIVAFIAKLAHKQ